MGKNPKCMWWKDEVKAVKIKLQRDEDVKRLQKKKKVKRCIYQSEKEVNKQFGRNTSRDMNGNGKQFRKENERKVESCSRINSGNSRLALGEEV